MKLLWGSFFLGGHNPGHGSAVQRRSDDPNRRIYGYSLFERVFWRLGSLATSPLALAAAFVKGQSYRASRSEVIGLLLAAFLLAIYGGVKFVNGFRRVEFRLGEKTVRLRTLFGFWDRRIQMAQVKEIHLVRSRAPFFASEEVSDTSKLSLTLRSGEHIRLVEDGDAGIVRSIEKTLRAMKEA